MDAIPISMSDSDAIPGAIYRNAPIVMVWFRYRVQPFFFSRDASKFKMFHTILFLIIENNAILSR